MGIKYFAGLEPQSHLKKKKKFSSFGFFFSFLSFFLHWFQHPKCRGGGQSTKAAHFQSPREGQAGGQSFLRECVWRKKKISWFSWVLDEVVWEARGFCRRALSHCAHGHQAASRSGSRRTQGWNLVPLESKGPFPSQWPFPASKTCSNPTRHSGTYLELKQSIPVARSDTIKPENL